MTQEEFDDINPGDVLLNRITATNWVVVAVSGERVIISRTMEIRSGNDWDIARKSVVFVEPIL